MANGTTTVSSSSVSSGGTKATPASTMASMSSTGTNGNCGNGTSGTQCTTSTTPGSKGATTTTPSSTVTVTQTKNCTNGTGPGCTTVGPTGGSSTGTSGSTGSTGGNTSSGSTPSGATASRGASLGAVSTASNNCTGTNTTNCTTVGPRSTTPLVTTTAVPVTKNCSNQSEPNCTLATTTTSINATSTTTTTTNSSSNATINDEEEDMNVPELYDLYNQSITNDHNITTVYDPNYRFSYRPFSNMTDRLIKDNNETCYIDQYKDYIYDKILEASNDKNSSLRVCEDEKVIMRSRFIGLETTDRRACRHPCLIPFRVHTVKMNVQNKTDDNKCLFLEDQIHLIETCFCDHNGKLNMNDTLPCICELDKVNRNSRSEDVTLANYVRMYCKIYKRKDFYYNEWKAKCRFQSLKFPFEDKYFNRSMITNDSSQYAPNYRDYQNMYPLQVRASRLSSSFGFFDVFSNGSKLDSTNTVIFTMLLLLLQLFTYIRNFRTERL